MEKQKKHHHHRYHGKQEGKEKQIDGEEEASPISLKYCFHPHEAEEALEEPVGGSSGSDDVKPIRGDEGGDGEKDDVDVDDDDDSLSVKNLFSFTASHYPLVEMLNYGVEYSQDLWLEGRDGEMEVEEGARIKTQQQRRRKKKGSLRRDKKTSRHDEDNLYYFFLSPTHVPFSKNFLGEMLKNFLVPLSSVRDGNDDDDDDDDDGATEGKIPRMGKNDVRVVGCSTVLPVPRHEELDLTSSSESHQRKRKEKERVEGRGKEAQRQQKSCSQQKNQPVGEDNFETPLYEVVSVQGIEEEEEAEIETGRKTIVKNKKMVTIKTERSVTSFHALRQRIGLREVKGWQDEKEEKEKKRGEVENSDEKGGKNIVRYKVTPAITDTAAAPRLYVLDHGFDVSPGHLRLGTETFFAYRRLAGMPVPEGRIKFSEDRRTIEVLDLLSDEEDTRIESKRNVNLQKITNNKKNPEIKKDENENEDDNLNDEEEEDIKDFKDVSFQTQQTPIVSPYCMMVDGSFLLKQAKSLHSVGKARNSKVVQQGAKNQHFRSEISDAPLLHMHILAENYYEDEKKKEELGNDNNHNNPQDDVEENKESGQAGEGGAKRHQDGDGKKINSRKNQPSSHHHSGSSSSILTTSAEVDLLQDHLAYWLDLLDQQVVGINLPEVRSSTRQVRKIFVSSIRLNTQSISLFEAVTGRTFGHNRPNIDPVVAEKKIPMLDRKRMEKLEVLTERFAKSKTLAFNDEEWTGFQPNTYAKLTEQQKRSMTISESEKKGFRKAQILQFLCHQIQYYSEILTVKIRRMEKIEYGISEEETGWDLALRVHAAGYQVLVSSRVVARLSHIRPMLQIKDERKEDEDRHHRQKKTPTSEKKTRKNGRRRKTTISSAIINNYFNREGIMPASNLFPDAMITTWFHQLMYWFPLIAQRYPYFYQRHLMGGNHHEDEEVDEVSYSGDATYRLSTPTGASASNLFPRFHIQWYAFCCHCCGFVNEIVGLAYPLRNKDGIGLAIGPNCFCSGYPTGVAESIERSYVRKPKGTRSGGFGWLRPSAGGSELLIWISHTNPESYKDVEWVLPGEKPEYFIGRSMTEFTRLPMGHAHYIEQFAHEVWVPCEFVRKTFVDSGVPETKLVIIPEAIDTELFHYKYNNDIGPQQRRRLLGWQKKSGAGSDTSSASSSSRFRTLSNLNLNARPYQKIPLPLPRGNPPDSKNSQNHQQTPLLLFEESFRSQYLHLSSNVPLRHRQQVQHKKQEWIRNFKKKKFWCNYELQDEQEEEEEGKETQNADNDNKKRKNLKRFKFFSDFKWESRKGWDVLLKAYGNTFTPDDPVSLYILSHVWFNTPRPYSKNNLSAIVEQILDEVPSVFHPNNQPQKQGEQDSEKPSAQDAAEDVGSSSGSAAAWSFPHVCFIVEDLSQSDIADLYSSMDAFVLPTRGEGWCLPALQAMSVGLPTIITNWGGNTAFATQRNSFLINLDGVEEVPVETEYEWELGKKWAIPSIEHTGELMKLVFRNRKYTKQVASVASKYVQEHFSEAAVAKIVHRRLQEVKNIVLRGLGGGGGSVMPSVKRMIEEMRQKKQKQKQRRMSGEDDVEAKKKRRHFRKRKYGEDEDEEGLIENRGMPMRGVTLHVNGFFQARFL